VRFDYLGFMKCTLMPRNAAENQDQMFAESFSIQLKMELRSILGTLKWPSTEGCSSHVDRGMSAGFIERVRRIGELAPHPGFIISTGRSAIGRSRCSSSIIRNSNSSIRGMVSMLDLQKLGYIEEAVLGIESPRSVQRNPRPWWNFDVFGSFGRNDDRVHA
jgi:hypothetical protein